MVRQDRTIWWKSYIDNVSLLTYDEGWSGELTGELELIATIRERCNCYEIYGSIMHHNGGNYHSIKRLYKVPDTSVYVLTHEDTREVFSADECFDVVIFRGGEAVGVICLKSGEWCQLLTEEEAKKTLKSYEEDDAYYIKYEED